MHPTLGRLRYQSGRATLSVIGSTAAATANSTPPYTVSPSPNSAVRVWGRLTLPNALPPATPRPRRSGPCAAVSAMRCTDDCRPMRLLELAWAASHEPLLDTGAIGRVNGSRPTEQASAWCARLGIDRRTESQATRHLRVPGLRSK